MTQRQKTKRRTAPPLGSTDDPRPYEVKIAEEHAVAAVVSFLRAEQEEVQRYLDNVGPGELRVGYSIGMRDALDMAVMAITAGKWRTSNVF